jgi:hypothetical protein
MGFTMFDITGLNAYTTYGIAHPDKVQGESSRRKFLLQLGKELVRPHIENRVAGLGGYHTDQRNQMIKFLKSFPDYQEPQQPDVAIEEAESSTKTRCFICIDNKVSSHAIRSICSNPLHEDARGRKHVCEKHCIKTIDHGRISIQCDKCISLAERAEEDALLMNI